MNFGISTACFYPELTETALKHLANNGIHIIELFVNTFRETSFDNIARLKAYLKEYDVQIVSVHPFTCSLESILFFSGYQSRFEDAIEQYKQWYFDFANEIGAEIFVLHGCNQHAKISSEFYCERFAALRDAAKQQGLVLAQENVAPFMSHSTTFIQEMREYLQDDVHFVLDIKQCIRAKENPYQMLEAMGKQLIHIHASDHNEKLDCLPIGQGDFDFTKMAHLLQQYQFDRSIILELYRQNYQEYCELYDCIAQLEKKMLF